MKKITYLIAGMAFVLGTRSAQAQSGYMFNQDWFNPQDMANISFWSPQYATARGTAMGGALSSLGADLSSMHINPAGLGMYQSSEFGITPVLTFSQATNSDPLGVISGGNRKTRFAPGNVGVALNFYQGTGQLTAFTFGFGYNRIADFNSKNGMYFGNNFASSIGDAMVQQLNGTDWSDRFYYDENFGRWGSLLAYENEFIRHKPGSSTEYEKAVADGVMSSQRVATSTSGSIGEYNISGGFNFGNKLYFGMSIGIQDLLYKQRIGYHEGYINNTYHDPAQDLYYDQYKKITGTGVNFKTGVIYRPVEALRIGLAVHTPTYFNISHQYTADVDVIFSDGGERKVAMDEYEIDFSTPVRMLGGISYTFGRTGVLSVDYERTWYNSMRYRNAESATNEVLKGDFTGTHTIRVGGELRPFDYDFSLRAGFNYTGSMADIDLNARYYETPVPIRNLGLSGGFGWRVGRRTMFDVAYSYNFTKYTDTYMYLYEYSNGNKIFGGNPKTSIKKHAILAGLSYRF